MPLVLLAALHLGAATPAAALPEPCPQLKGAAQTRALRLLGSLYPYECCDDTIAACLQQAQPCSLAVRLAANVCRRVVAGHDDERIRRAISRRARSVLGGGQPAVIDLTGVNAAGRDDAPVTVVIYACPRCPYCARLVPALHAAVTTGALAGKARLYVRIFPIRGHPGATDAALLWQAAAAQGRLWPYLLAAYGDFPDDTAAAAERWARAAGLEAQRLAAEAAHEATREAVVAAKKEGIVNGVTETPTLFLNGVRYVGELDLEEVVDVLDELARRSTEFPDQLTRR